MTYAGENLERVEVQSSRELREWLELHHQQLAGVWLVTYKKHSGVNYVARTDIIDELLCYGWIDGRMLKLDDVRVMQLVSPRRVHHWARSYKERVERLESQGRMRPAGLAAIALSKSLNLWECHSDVDALEVPAELELALHQEGIRHEFDTLPISYRRNLLRWVKLAKRSETKIKRISQIAESTLKGLRIPQM